jgi:hypothetical protein
MSEAEPEQEAAQDFARKLFGSRPEPEPNEGEQPTEPEQSKADPTEPEPQPEPSSPENRHQQFLGDLLGGAAKREVDERLFGTGHPPTPTEGDE